MIFLTSHPAAHSTLEMFCHTLPTEESDGFQEVTSMYDCHVVIGVVAVNNTCYSNAFQT
ncbi:hypothetical protein EXN66_Car002797 [Channa argus]|uniref:Uncharacterized protein n=1 Tax=Channa argus TaxID=215402 RepID=A0A6G1PA38_CHAAH|nr:hypothetical protein EXN66_Car002797 [Channa argus]